MAKKRRRKRRGAGEAPESSGRRGFFRDLLVQAIEVGEHVGKNMAERARPRYPWMDTTPDPYKYDPSMYNYDYGHDHHDDDTPYGPPWPPVYGPSTPMRLQRQMREWHKTPPVDTVSRSGTHHDDHHHPPD